MLKMRKFVDPLQLFERILCSSMFHFSLLKDAGHDAPSQRDLTCTGASVSAKGRARKVKTTRRQSSFCPSAIHNTQARMKHDAHSKKAQDVHTTKIERKDINMPAQTTKTCHACFPLVASSHHTPLLCCHGPSTVRGEHSSVTAGLSVATPTTRPHPFPGTACPGPCGRLVPPLPTPNPARKERPCHLSHATR